ncbi:MAG: nickel pincer cofactor biosynthesis protein LarC [Syntrophomonadaceae bacterium]|jgi:uncharacterized protein (TIGR00299 family) protein|nr:nickel pincer cofactor biosynthesis protein LarC [Syntrophomonadaceae bacterium]
MNKILYFDCFAGISGDMVVGALLDLGAKKAKLCQHLSGLKLSGYRLHIEKQQKMSIWGTDFRVVLEDEPHSHHHNSHSHGSGPSHSHRGLKEISALIGDSLLSPQVKSRSLDIFSRIAQAEARVHGISPEEVHFHEVGAVDSIIDVVAAMICIEDINIQEIYSSPLHLGEGLVSCAHGLLPVPAPAVLEILQGVPVYTNGLRSELTTPTGAAIISHLAKEFGPLPEIQVEATAYGLGDKNLEIPNLLRVIKGRLTRRSPMWMMECNIDDMNTQFYSYILPLLMEQGAVDVYLSPLIMKKNRPGHCLSILCDEQSLDRLEAVLWQETSTLGVRRFRVERRILERELLQVPTRWGIVPVKAAYYQGQRLKCAPEYEDLARIAREQQLPLPQIYKEVQLDIAHWLAEQG